jgi:hypothetical protein
VVATNYLYSTYFKMDLISFIPWGLIGTAFDERLKFLWVVKALRISNLNYYMQDKRIMPIIDYFIQTKQKKAYNDPILRESMDFDQTFIN